MLQHRGAVLTSFAIGAGLMYFMDPGRGRSRRALVRDQITHAAHVTTDVAGAKKRHLANRVTGMLARLRRACSTTRADRAPIESVSVAR